MKVISMKEMSDQILKGGSNGSYISAGWIHERYTAVGMLICDGRTSWQSFGNLSDAVDWVKRKEQKLYEMYKGRLRL